MSGLKSRCPVPLLLYVSELQGTTLVSGAHLFIAATAARSRKSP